ncbi:type VII secretion target [Lentzea sp. NPDC005914]|uniref:type VII secretion target n=1 Tax=Lentzea sp. NPDC005914 TaxID=3154572 RepID=UPI0033F520B8
MTSFTVDHEQLRRHATTLAGYADQLSATGTALPDQLGQESLGSFAQFLTAGLGNAMGETLNAFSHVASTMDKVGEGMRQTADMYQRTDDDNAAAVVGAGR